VSKVTSVTAQSLYIFTCWGKKWWKRY